MSEKAKTIRAIDLRPGNVVIYDDGSQSAVKTIGYGDTASDGFHEYQGRVSAALIVEFEDGRKQATHPSMPVKVIDQIAAH